MAKPKVKKQLPKSSEVRNANRTLAVAQPVYNRMSPLGRSTSLDGQDDEVFFMGARRKSIWDDRSDDSSCYNANTSPSVARAHESLN